LSEQKSKWVESEAILNQLMEIARISALAEMASGIAHELNQPLGAIATFSQAGDRLLNRPEPQVQRALEVFRQINAEAMAAGEGIRRIRRLFDQHGTNREPCQMRIKAQFQVDVAPGLPDVLIDRLRIQHVLFALVQNAFDASSQNSAPPRVKVEVRADRYAVETSITDSGSGVSAEIREQLFRPFFTTKPQGTGLGLASARAIIEAHQGTIGFETLPDYGSRFWFRLPIGS